VFPAGFPAQNRSVLGGVSVFSGLSWRCSPAVSGDRRAIVIAKRRNAIRHAPIIFTGQGNRTSDACETQHGLLATRRGVRLALWRRVNYYTTTNANGCGDRWKLELTRKGESL